MLVVLSVALVHYLLLVVVHVLQEDLMAVGYHPLSDQLEVLDPQLEQVPILLVVVQPMELKQDE